jgi:hypothetical protein
MVCLSNRDGVLVPDIAAVSARERARFDSDGWYRWATKPVALRLVHPAALVKNRTRFYWSQGTLVVACCWRSSAHGHSPSHALYGLGTIFEASLGHTRLAGAVDTLLLHQCSDALLRQNEGIAAWIDGPPWSWGNALWQHVHSAMRARWPDTASNVVTLGARHPTSSLPSSGDVVVCGGDVWVPRMTGHYFGSNRGATVAAWRSQIAPWLNRTGVAGEARSTPFNVQPARVPTLRMAVCTKGCSSGLRVAIFQRVEGMWGQRSIANIERVVAVAQTYVGHPVRVISVSSQTSVADQVRLFQSFDVLVSTHGSQLANMIYANKRAVIIELQAIPGSADSSFEKNAWAVIGGHLMSYGHMPAAGVHNAGQTNATGRAAINCVLARRMRPCWWWQQQGGCSDGGAAGTIFKHSDLIVDADRLRAALDRAMAIRCASERVPRQLLTHVEKTAKASACENASATAHDYFNAQPPRLSEQCAKLKIAAK